MKKLELETLVGQAVIVTCVALALANVRADTFNGLAEDRYALTARFDDVGGLAPNSPVRSAGVTVGRVAAVTLDAQRHRGRLTLEIDGDVRFPVDSAAQVRNAGLLGERYVAIEPGADHQRLNPGDEMVRTQSALVLEQVIERLVSRKAKS